MLKIFQKSFGILINNLLLIQPLLLLVIFISVTLYIMQGKIISSPAQIIYFILIFIMSIAVFSGWFYISKLGIEHYDSDLDSQQLVQNSIADFKQFFNGVGQNFGKFIFATVFFLIVNFAFAKTLGLFTEKYAQIIIQISNSTPTDALNILFTLTDSEKIKLLLYLILQIFSGFIFVYWWILMLGIFQAENKNWFKLLWESIKFPFVNLLESICVIFVMMSLFFFINIIFGVLGTNVIIASIFSILVLLYFNYYVIVVLCLYNEKRENNSNSGTELFG